MSSNPEISVIIPSFGRADLLRRCLDAAAAQITPAACEIIVADSTPDRSVTALVARFPGVRLVRSERRLFPGAARNLGAAHARGPLLAFLDADCVPEPSWLDCALATVRAGARVSGGPVLDTEPFHPLAVSDNLLQFADFPGGRPAGAAVYFPGCNLALRRETLETLGRFRPDLPAGEDVLLTMTAAARWPEDVRFVPGQAVRHHGRSTLRAYWRHQWSLGFYRGALGLQLSPRQRRMGRSAWLLAPVATKRLAYITRRTFQWNRSRVPVLLTLLPLLKLGLLAWSLGFRQGCRATLTGTGKV